MLVLEKENDKLSIEAEKSVGWELVAKANAIQEFALVKCSIIAELTTAVMNLENSKNDLDSSWNRILPQ